MTGVDRSATLSDRAIVAEIGSFNRCGCPGASARRCDVTLPPRSRPETHRLFLMDAICQCRAELMATQSWLRGEVAELRKELVAPCAELHRLRAAAKTQRDPDATLN